MGHLQLKAADRKLIRNQLKSAYDQFTLRLLIQESVPAVDSNVQWMHPGGADLIFSDAIDKTNMRGLLDHLLAAVAADRPFRPDLRALAVHFSRYPGWSTPVEAHGMDLAAGLEKLTSAGNPFLDTTRLARWLIRTERQVCQVRCGGEHGTGFLVGRDLVLTCYHVVQSHLTGAVAAGEVKVRFDYRRDVKGVEPPYDQGAWLGLDPGWQIPHSRYSQADLTLQGEPAANELDYALLKLQAAAGDDPPADEDDARGWVDMSSDVALPPEESPILIVQHPGREIKPPPQEPLKITFATPGFESAIANGTRVKYKPSTRPGSSGSPVYGPDFRAVALHHNRGQIHPAAVDLVSNNRGIPLARIRAALAEDVRAELVAPPA